MKLFALPDATIDRNDRAQWLTMPFDLAFGGVLPSHVGPVTVQAKARLTFGVKRRDRLGRVQRTS